MDSVENIIERLRKGTSMEDIAAEVANTLNAAAHIYEEECAERARIEELNRQKDAALETAVLAMVKYAELAQFENAAKIFKILGTKGIKSVFTNFIKIVDEDKTYDAAKFNEIPNTSKS